MRNRIHAALFPAPSLIRETPLASAFGLTAAGVFVQGLTRLGYSILVGRFLGPAALGDLASMLALASFLVLFWPSAGGNAAGKFIAMARGEGNLDSARATERFVAVSSTIGGVILGIVGAFVVVLQFQAGWFAAIMVGSLTLSLSGYNFSRGLRVGYGHFWTTAVWDLIASALSLACLIGVLIAGWNAILLAPMVVGYGLFAIAAWPFTREHKLPRERRNEILRFTAWSSLNIMAAGGLLQLSIVLARQWSSGDELGLYSAAVQLATPASMLSSAMLTAMGPTLVTRYAAGELPGMRRELGRIMNITVVFFMPFFTVGVIWAPVIISVFFGSDFSGAAVYLGILFIAVSATSFNAASARLNGAEARGIRELAAINLTALIVGLTVMIWLGSSLGALGSAIGYLVGAIISSAAPFFIVWKRDSMAWLPVLARILVAYVVMAVALGGQQLTNGAVWWNLLCTLVFVTVWPLMNKSTWNAGLRGAIARLGFGRKGS